MDSTNTPGAQNAKWAPQMEHPQIIEMMDCWVLQERELGVLLSGEALRMKWTQFAELAGIPTKDHLSPSEGWLEKFEKCHNLQNIKRRGEAGSTDMETVEVERAHIQKIIHDGGCQPRDIYNMDKTGLFHQ